MARNEFGQRTASQIFYEKHRDRNVFYINVLQHLHKFRESRSVGNAHRDMPTVINEAAHIQVMGLLCGRYDYFL